MCDGREVQRRWAATVALGPFPGLQLSPAGLETQAALAEIHAQAGGDADATPKAEGHGAVGGSQVALITPSPFPSRTSGWTPISAMNLTPLASRARRTASKSSIVRVRQPFWKSRIML